MHPHTRSALTVHQICYMGCSIAPRGRLIKQASGDEYNHLSDYYKHEYKVCSNDFSRYLLPPSRYGKGTRGLGKH